MTAHGVKDDMGIYLHFADFVDRLARNRTSGGTPMHWHDYWAAAKQVPAPYNNVTHRACM